MKLFVFAFLLTLFSSTFSSKAQAEIMLLQCSVSKAEGVTTSIVKVKSACFAMETTANNEYSARRVVINVNDGTSQVWKIVSEKILEKEETREGEWTKTVYKIRYLGLLNRDGRISNAPSREVTTSITEVVKFLAPWSITELLEGKLPGNLKFSFTKFEHIPLP